MLAGIQFVCFHITGNFLESRVSRSSTCRGIYLEFLMYENQVRSLYLPSKDYMSSDHCVYSMFNLYWFKVSGKQF